MESIQDSDAGTSKDSCFYEDSSSSNTNIADSSTAEEKPLVTKEMEEEERKMAEQNKKEEDRVKKQYEKELETQEQQKLEKQAKYKRLMHLLNQSQFYTNFLLKKIEASNLKEAKRLEAKKKAEEKKSQTESRSLKEINNSTDSSAIVAQKKNPKKRSLITDFIDNETIDNVKKKRRVDSDDILKKPLESSEGSGVRINSMGFEVPENQPELFEGGVLRQYQLNGLEWMKALFENGVNGILADEMGLGKTIQVISLLCHLIDKGISGPFLIVAPLSTLPNWMMEFERFAPQIPTILFHGSKHDRPKMYKKLKTKVKINERITVAPVVLTSYQIPLMEQQFMSTFNWRYIIVDEGHALKNSNTQLSRCLRSFKSVNRLLLTGTPLQNNLTELWALLNFLLPEVFDDLVMFQALFDIEAVTNSETGQSIIQKESESHILTTLHQILTPFLLRRLKSDVELNLPSKKEVLVFCPMTDLQMELYKATIDKVIEALLRSKREEEEVPAVDLNGPRKKRKCAEKKKDYTFKEFDWYGEREHQPEEKPVEQPKKDPSVYTNLHMACPEMQLRKIANHPYLVQMPIEVVDGDKQMVSSEAIVTESGKMLALNAMLLKLHQRGHKVLIFSFFKMMLNLIEEFAIMRDYRYVRLDGDDSIEDRKQNIRAFNTDPGIFLFLITTRAGGLGLNLTSADTVIIFDSDYNPQVDLQAMDRCHRIGQKKPVIVYRFISKGTVDEKILQTATGKRKLEKVVIKKGLFKLNASSNKKVLLNDLEELKQLLESADHHKTMQTNGLVFTDEELEELLDRKVDTSDIEGSHFKVMKAEPAAESKNHSVECSEGQSAKSEVPNSN